MQYVIDLTLARFKSPDGKGIDSLGWFVVMQHYGAPTRFLDWSSSPWAALYFACQQDGESDGMLYIADFKKLNAYTDMKLANLGKQGDHLGLLFDPTAPDILMLAMTYNTNERIEAQQSRFSICTNPFTDHLVILEEAQAANKIKIPKELKPFVMMQLNQMNITAKTLFPGIDGLGRSIVEYCNLWDKSSVIQ